MESILPGLTPEENEQMLDAIPLITLLIGTADGKFDIMEADEGRRLTKIRSYTYDSELKEYYKHVSAMFDVRLNYFQRHMPADLDSGQVYLTERLRDLDPLLQKIDGEMSYLLYQDFLSLAEHVAKSSGGVFFMGNISPSEKAMLELNMLTPINTYRGI